MEPTFETKTIQYLRETFSKTIRREETAETAVPDGEPDPDRVLACSANAVLRSKECRTGSAELNGGIQADVAYLSAGEKRPRSLSVYMPFRVDLDDAQLEPESRLKVCVFVRSADARIVHSRRIQTRVSLVLFVHAYSEAEETIRCPSELPETIQMKTVVYPMLLPTDYAETSVPIEEELTLPAESDADTRVLLCTIDPILTESRVAGDKAVFQGDLRLHLLCQSGETAPTVFERKIPFSRYCVLNETYENATADFCVVLTGSELRPDAEGSGTLQFNADLLVQCTVADRVPVPLCEDAYAVNGRWEPEWQECAFRDLLDRRSLGCTMRENAELPAVSVVDAIAFRDCAEQERTENRTRISVPVTAQILYYDTAGDLQRCLMHGKAEAELPLSENSACEMSAALGEITAQQTPSGVSVSCPVEIAAACYADQTYRSICGGKLTEESEQEKKPAVILRRASEGESLWELAKQYRSTEKKIAQANGISADCIPAPMTVLIPL